MKINIYIIHKKIYNLSYLMELKKFGIKVNIIPLFNKEVSQAQSLNSNIAKKSYTKLFSNYLNKKSILLHERGELLDSMEFANMIQNKIMKDSEVNFFISGAFGFESDILNKYQSIGLSPLTFSHEIVLHILLEQLYRCFSILNNHPYHK